MGVKRTWIGTALMSLIDPKRTSGNSFAGVPIEYEVGVSNGECLQDQVRDRVGMSVRTKRDDFLWQ
jgi:hypothetical protein